MYTLQAGVFVILLCSVAAEVVNFEQCPPITTDHEEPVVIPRNCTVHEVRVTPCPEAADDEPCKLKKGKIATIEFEFTSDVGVDSLTQKAYWVNPLGDLPLAGMEPNGCDYTTCPVTAGQRQSYSYQLSISKKFPTRAFDVKWKLYKEEVMECCFIYKIKLVK